MPQAYETRNLVPPATATALLGALCRTGLPCLLLRLTANQSPAIKAGSLFAGDKAAYRTLFFKNFVDPDIQREINTVKRQRPQGHGSWIAAGQDAAIGFQRERHWLPQG